MDCYTSLPEAKEECGRRSTERLEFVAQGCVTCPDSGDEHDTVVVEEKSRVQYDTSGVELSLLSLY